MLKISLLFKKFTNFKLTNLQTREFLGLRYYTTFKVRKFECLFYKLIHVCKKLPLALDCGQSKYS